MTGLTIKPEAQQEILRDLCERNRSAELVYVPDDGPPMRTRVRFLQLSDDTLLIDNPMLGGRPMPLRQGDAVRIHFVLDEHRLAFTTRVHRRTRWSEDGGKPINALIVDVPAEVERAQRRECYRLSLWNLAPVVARFVPKENGGEEAFEATMVNLSETGCGVILDKATARKAGVHDAFVVTFFLPGHDEPFVLPAEVRWSRPVGDEEQIRLGVMWDVDWSVREDRQVQRQLALFIVEQQRRALRRARESDACE